MCSGGKNQWQKLRPQGKPTDATKPGGGDPKKDPKKEAAWGGSAADWVGTLAMVAALYMLGFFGSPFSEPQLESIDFQHFRNELLAKDLVDKVWPCHRTFSF